MSTFHPRHEGTNETTTASSLGLSAIHEDIEKSMVLSKLCVVDTSKILKQPEWIDFFANLTTTNEKLTL